jgi:hypothetical protein
MRIPVSVSFVFAAAVLGCGAGSDAELTNSDDAPLEVGEGPDAATACVFTTQLRPENEIRPPPPDDPVESVASGHSQVKIRTDATLELRTFIRNPAGETFIAGHIHEAPAGSNGAIVQPLFSSSGDASERIQQVQEFALDPDFAEAICADPEEYYVNYHTTQDPAGAIRGQLR